MELQYDWILEEKDGFIRTGSIWLRIETADSTPDEVIGFFN
jgi:hypothetical protein